MLLKYFIINLLLFVTFGVSINVNKNNQHANWVGKGVGSKYPCPTNNNKLLSLLNLLCNTTQTTSLTTRDACYGCFFRAGSLPAGATQLSSLSQCSTMYLANSTYARCALDLQAIASGARPTTPPTYDTCYTGYCDFVQCVRRTNANTLIDNCVQANLVQRNLVNQADRIAFYTNTTSCILARTRCNQYNPITGEIQFVNRVYGPYPQAGNRLFLSNSLQISTAGDIRIVSFPLTTGISDYFCSAQQTLDQSGFGDAVC